MTRNELTALKYIGLQMEAWSDAIGRVVFPERKKEFAAAGSAVAASLRRKGLVKHGPLAGTWRLTADGREEFEKVR